MGSGRHLLIRRPNLAGLTAAAVGYAAALTPSLLPHKLMFLLLLTALGTLSLYAIGTTASWAACRIPRLRDVRAPWAVQVAIPALAWLAAFAFTPVAVTWQGEQQSALDMPAALPSTVTVIALTAVVSAVLLLIARLLRLGTNRLATFIARIRPVAGWISSRQPSRVHRAIAGIRLGVAVLLIIVFVGVLRIGIGLLIGSYDSVNADASGQSATGLGENSGSPQSKAPWDTLGREGRFFVGNTMAPADIEAISGRPAQTPVRLYVGMQQGDTPEARTAIALEELDRVGAWDRTYLTIIGVTGTGWVNPDGINSLETVTGGDSTSVAVQYSAVPSWIGFILDPETTQVQNRDTVNAIVAKWRTMPAGHRPELILFGESLGSFGSQAAWDSSDSPEQVSADVRKIIWIGPPAESNLWSTWQADRTAGPAWQPVMGDGSIAHVYISPRELEAADGTSGPSITFVAHPNDPVVYWSPSILLQKPDWLDQPLGPGVMPQTRWFPIITYLQVGMDLISGGEPPEVGHNYAAGIGPAVALTVNSEGWTQENTARLQAALPKLMYTTG
jgi:uncharacterized membrane protein